MQAPIAPMQGERVFDGTFALISAATTNDTLIKVPRATGRCVRVYNGSITNYSVATKYVKLYDKATQPVVGTDVPRLTIAVPAGATAIFYAGDLGHEFLLGLGLGITGLQPDNDATAVAVGDVKVEVNYFL